MWEREGSNMGRSCDQLTLRRWCEMETGHLDNVLRCDWGVGAGECRDAGRTLQEVVEKEYWMREVEEKKSGFPLRLSGKVSGKANFSADITT